MKNRLHMTNIKGKEKGCYQILEYRKKRKLSNPKCQYSNISRGAMKDLDYIESILELLENKLQLSRRDNGFLWQRKISSAG
jgi:hypothetical protein